MNSRLDPPLVARNGKLLKVLGIARISTDHQNEMSLEDQKQLYRRWLKEHTPLPFDLHCIAGRGSGECLDRAESREAEAAVESREFDLVLAEDLGRIFRRMQAYIFCETCEDFETRLIAINDYVDTFREDWRLTAFFAAMRHEAYNRDTGKRIRRTLRNRFVQGGVFQCAIYGYIKPPGAICDDDVRKDPDAEPVYETWFCRLEAGDSFADVADWLNEEGIPMGPYCRSDRWTGPMVARITRNPILKGVRVRNDKMSKRINKTGRRKSVKAPPEERLERYCPHLAFIDPDRYDNVIRMLAEGSKKYRRNGDDGQDPRADVPKMRTRFPGQMIDCGICGRLYVYGGHGQTDHLMCTGARGYRCWNGVTVDGPLAAQRIALAVNREIESLPDFDQAALAAIREQAAKADESRQKSLRQFALKEQQLNREIDNVLAFIRRGDASDRVHEELRSLEQAMSQVRYDHGQLSQQPEQAVEVPDIADIRKLWESSVSELAIESWDFCKLMRRLIEQIEVYPHRLCDGGHIVLRARFRVRLTKLLTDSRLQSALPGNWNKVVTVDLFDPPQREEYRSRVVSLRRHMPEQQVAKALGITQTAAQRAAALQRMLDALGVDDAYRPVHEPPDDYGKLSRHKNARYDLDPLPNAGRLWRP